MSKGSLFWANARGKLGEAVFYRAGGEQRNRTYVKSIRNPKTVAQAEQRLSMLNFSAGFRLLAPILRHSFPNRSANMSGFNAFVKVNKTVASPVIDRTIAEKGLAVLGQMIVSQGNLILGSGHQFYADAFTDPEAESAPSLHAVGYRLPLPAAAFVQGTAEYEAWELLKQDADGSPSVSISTQARLRAVLDLLGLSRSAVLTVIKGGYEDDGFAYSHGSMAVSGNAEDAVSNGITPIYVLNAEGLDLAESSEIIVGVRVLATEDDSEYWGLIVSDKVNGKLDVSTVRLVPSGSDTRLTTQFMKGGFVYQQIMDDYGPAQANVLQGGQS